MEKAPRSCWILTEDVASLRHQAGGLAAAMGLAPVVGTVGRPMGLARFLPAAFWPRPLALVAGVDLSGGAWPDILITAGKCGGAVSPAIRKASGGRTFTVHIQNPKTAYQKFDALVVPAHDRVAAPNALATCGAVHHLTHARIAQSTLGLGPRIAHLPPFRVAVMVGGPSRNHRFGPELMADFAAKLAAAARASGAGLIVTTSRRTGAENEAVLRHALKDTPAWIWDGTGDNPYPGMLGAVDAIVVTGDSVSMVSEACYTGKPVHVFDVPVLSRRLRRFGEDLRAQGLTRGFSGVFETWDYAPLDETARAARFVLDRFAARRVSA